MEDTNGISLDCAKYDGRTSIPEGHKLYFSGSELEFGLSVHKDTVNAAISTSLHSITIRLKVLNTPIPHFFAK